MKKRPLDREKIPGNPSTSQMWRDYLPNTMVHCIFSCTCVRIACLAKGLALGFGFGSVVNTLQLHDRSEEHTSELQSLMRISYAVFCLKKKIKHNQTTRK